MIPCPSCSAAIEPDARFCAHCGAALAATTPIAHERTAPIEGLPPARPAGDGRFLPGALLAQRYRIVGLLGRGGMGEVYRADDVKVGQTVALKFLPESLARDHAALERFFGEVRIGRQVSHPSVCRLYDLVELEGHHALSMEFVDGEDLATLLKRIGRLPTGKAIDFAREICAGLAAAHDKGVIHRDLKPANVMIDGKGRARITDFGIAALAGDESARAGFAGTPAYMAPEQLDGKPASVQSDVFALGLLLYETFCGRRLYEAPSLDALKAQHRRADPPSLSSLAGDIPPEVEQVVQRCLARDPAQRPSSAHAVLAALPGGDPLSAALAAGETPTPEMVAAAGAVGGLGAGAAWAALVACIAGMLALIALSGSATMIGRLKPELPPDALSVKARALLATLGYDTKPFDEASMFDRDDSLVSYLRKRDASPRRWAGIEALRPGPILFVHRESARPLVARKPIVRPFQPAEVGRVTPDDPPLVEGGMIDVVLDTRGALVALAAYPPERAEHAPAASSPDWTRVTAAAGFAPGALATSAPIWNGPFAADAHAAWDGTLEGQPDIAFHAEATALDGRVNWFQMRGPWATTRLKLPLELTGPVAVGFWVVLVASGIASFAIMAMVRRNIRLGRGDTAGARRLANAVFWTTFLALLVRADHVASLYDEANMLVLLISQAVFFAFASWAFYLAMEPTARRRWPALLISWTRLLAGRWRDPMVGRDVLLGALGGIAMLIVVYAGTIVPAWLGRAPNGPHFYVLTLLGAPRHLLYFVLSAPCLGVLLALGALFQILFYRTIVRSHAVALAMAFGVTYLVLAFFSEDPGQLGGTALVFTAIWFAVLLRLGVLAASVAITVEGILDALPLTFDASAWYAGRGYVGLAIVAALVAYGFHRALAGKPLLGRALLDET